MKKQNLTEEIYRMRKLMNFDSKEFNENTTSEDKLIEEYFINEQKRTKGWKFALKFWPGSKGFGSGGFYFKPRMTKKINVFDWHTPPSSDAVHSHSPLHHTAPLPCGHSAQEEAL